MYERKAHRATTRNRGFAALSIALSIVTYRLVSVGVGAMIPHEAPSHVEFRPRIDMGLINFR